MKYKFILIISILGVILSIVLSGIFLNFSYFEPDTASYLFQAKLFTQGKISIPVPIKTSDDGSPVQDPNGKPMPEYGLSPSPHINMLNGKWYSKYPFGNALMLMFGEFFNAPWLIPALATGAAIFLLFLLVKDTYGKPIAFIAAVIALISPATSGMGSTWFSEPVSRFYLTLFLFSLVRTLNGKGGIIYPLLSGFALGYAFNTRPLSAIVFGVVGAGFVLYHLYKLRLAKDSSNIEEENETNTPSQKQLVTRLGIFLIPFALWVLVCMTWNHHFTGNPFKFTHTAAQPYDKIGFGKRTESYYPDIERAWEFKPIHALNRPWRHILPCISFNALGWGNYRPRLITEAKPSLKFFFDFLPLLIPWFFVLIPFFHSTRNRYDVLCMSFIVGCLILYAFFYFEGSTWGFTPVNARYYTEAIFLGFIPLAARGMYILYQQFKKPIWTNKLAYVAGICLLLLSVNTVWSYVRIGKVYQNWSAVYQKLPPLVKKFDIHNAVIFVPGTRDAPVGDYPFDSMEEANIVYFKLGPAPHWGLTNSDWKNVYKEYFKGRDAYLYEPGPNNIKPLIPDP
ncbi:MAG: glycosyltransferase family 39 protein [Candidatus Poribacteria bacterium]|nr:glycosyltransferase family 39 protein [Candidatus Poribacteria bacterium]